MGRHERLHGRRAHHPVAELVANTSCLFDRNDDFDILPGLQVDQVLLIRRQVGVRKGRDDEPHRRLCAECLDGRRLLPRVPAFDLRTTHASNGWVCVDWRARPVLERLLIERHNVRFERFTLGDERALPRVDGRLRIVTRLLSCVSQRAARR
eukprot:6438435-Prymnesium_polylepis.3